MAIYTTTDKHSMPTTYPQADWNGSKLTVTSSLMSKRLRQAASIDVFLDGKRILETGGQLKITGCHSTQFEYAGENHEVNLLWGRPDLRSFPIELQIDGRSILKSRVFTKNWFLAYFPWIVFASFIICGVIK